MSEAPGARGAQLDALRGRLRSFGGVVEAMADCALVVGADGRFIRASESVRAVLGYEPEEMIGRSPGEFTHAEDVAPGDEKVAEARVTAGHVAAPSFVARVRHKRGGWRYLSSVLLDLTSEPLYGGILMLVRDVTARELAKRELADKSALLRNAQRLAGLGSWRFDPESARFECVRALLELHGAAPRGSEEYLTLTPEEVRETLLAGVCEDDRARVEAFMLGPHDEGEPTIEYCVTRPDGGRRHLAGRLQIGRGSQALLGAVQDITQRRESETRLREREELLEIAQRLSNTGSWSIELPGGSTSWSEQMYRIHGVSPETFALPGVDAQVTAFVHPDDAAAIHAALARALAAGESPPPLEYRIRRPDGEVRHVLAHASQTIFSERGAPARIVGAVQDVTERTRAERERERLLGELADKNAELERFTITATHDLKSPLLTIQGFLRFIERDLERGDVTRARADLGRVARAAETMRQLLDSLLDLSRVARPVEPVTVSLSEVARAIVRCVSASGAGARARIVIDAPLPDARGDRARISTALQHLIENAVTFTGDQEAPTVRVHAELIQGGAWVRCGVTDNGVGVDPQFHERIFGLFERLDPGSPGAGIGLTVSRRVIEAHGGELWVESAGPGAGCTFYFTLPADTDAPARDRPATPAAPPARA
ncbi:MAG: PAS domain S-box protein [Myxococcales bacterium]|nr:PAS domain S-box protein [Myxococcales bacterium]MCB9754657.1 PAS domain S-box protein [Myxococcales bacterium]